MELQVRMMPSCNKSIKRPRQLTLLRALEPERFANGMAVTTSMGDPLDRDGNAVDRNRRRPGEFTCFTLISEDAINSSFARAISSAAPWLTNLT
ncbi:MAG: hypothetical protein WA303_22870 [Bradyrhizobium sp.]